MNFKYSYSLLYPTMCVPSIRVDILLRCIFNLEKIRMKTKLHKLGKYRLLYKLNRK